jgi:AcrR family transcriptional regulator
MSTKTANGSVKSARRRDRTREALLRAGRSLLAKRTVDGVSVDEIVAAAAVAKGSFYNHFADKDVFAREIGSAVRRQVENAINTANEGLDDPAQCIARGLCVFMRFAIEHRDSAQVLWRFHSGATMADAPINRGLRALVERGIETERFKHVDIESGVLLVIGVIVIALRHAFEERLTTAPAELAQHMASGLLRALGIPAAQAERLSMAAAQDMLGPKARVSFEAI